MVKKLSAYFNSHTPQLQGVIWMVIHCFFGAIFSANGRVVVEKYHITQVVFIHCVGAMICMVLWSNKNIKNDLKTKKIKLHLLRALLGLFAVTAWLLAVTYNPIAEATAIAFLNPTIASILAVLILKEKITKHRALALLIGLAGVIIILRPGIEVFRAVSLFALAAAFLFALIDICIKSLAKTETIKTQTLYTSVLQMLFVLPFAVYFWQTPTIYDFILMLSLGLLTFIIIVTICKALESGDITFIIPFIYTSMIFNALIAYIMFDEKLDIFTILGAIIIAAGSLNIIIQEKLSAKRIKSDAIDARP